MKTGTGKILSSLVLLFGLLLVEANAQINLESGKIGIRVSNAGSIRFMNPATSGTRQIERVNIIAGLSEKAVCDYNEDQDVVIAAYKVAAPKTADVEGVAYYSNVSSGLPPNLNFRLWTYMWTGEPYVITKYAVINDSSAQVNLQIGLVAVPRVGGNYGGETNAYNAAQKTAYCFREGEAAYAGIRLLSKAPHSFKTLDWNAYSPDDPNADAATDSTRYHMTADAGFDAAMVAGGDGSIFSLNAGGYTLAPHDSVVLTYGVVYGNTLDEMLAASAAMQAKYDSKFATAVEKKEFDQMPSTLNLAQNYPNPFNPSTTIAFDLHESSDINMAVYNMYGQRVQTLATGFYTAGAYTATWNGKDDNGRDASAGVYICRLTSGTTTISKKMILVR
jgi:hypothetical protein